MCVYVSVRKYAGIDVTVKHLYVCGMQYADLGMIAFVCVCVCWSEEGGRVTFGRCCSLGCMCISGLMFM